MQRYQIRLHRPPAERSTFLRVLRLVAPMGLKQVAALADHLDQHPGQLLVAGLERAVAEHLRRMLHQAGAEVEMQPSSIETPMLCSPLAQSVYERRWFGIVPAGR